MTRALMEMILWVYWVALLGCCEQDIYENKLPQNVFPSTQMFCNIELQSKWFSFSAFMFSSGKKLRDFVEIIKVILREICSLSLEERVEILENKFTQLEHDLVEDYGLIRRCKEPVIDHGVASCNYKGIIQAVTMSEMNVQIWSQGRSARWSVTQAGFHLLVTPGPSVRIKNHS